MRSQGEVGHLEHSKQLQANDLACEQRHEQNHITYYLDCCNELPNRLLALTLLLAVVESWSSRTHLVIPSVNGTQIH